MRPVVSTTTIVARRRSRHPELHWIPCTSAGSLRPEFAIVDRELGDRDWASIDPVRVRTSKGVRHRFTPAMYLWQRTRSHVWCESQEERWEVLWLDYGGQVERLWSQPLAIVFGHGSRLSGASHTPDFLAQFADGAYGLFDVRPADRIDDHAEVQFSESAKVCAALGWHYRVLTGHDRLATQNLNSLSASRHERCMPTPETEVVILESARDGITRRELSRVASPACPPLACAWIDNLAWRRLLRLDLGAVFNSDTEFTTSDRAFTGEPA